MKGDLCKHCDECKEHTYHRVNRKGVAFSFKYCEANKHLVALSDWYLEKDGYVYSTKRLWGVKRFLHTFYKSKRDGDIVIDHVNGVRTDNRLCNLRKVTAMCNAQNKHTKRTSIFPGVFRKGDKFTSTCKGKYLGTYDSEFEAYHVYVNYIKSIGSTINTETKAYKIYCKWLDESKQATLI